MHQPYADQACRVRARPIELGDLERASVADDDRLDRAATVDQQTDLAVELTR